MCTKLTMGKLKIKHIQLYWKLGENMGVGEFYVLLLCIDKKLSRNSSSFDGWIDISEHKDCQEYVDQLFSRGYILLSLDKTKVKLVRFRKEYKETEKLFLEGKFFG